MPHDYKYQRTFSDTEFVEQAMEAHAEREHVEKTLAPQTRKVLSYKGTTPIYEDEPTFFGSLFAAFK